MFSQSSNEPKKPVRLGIWGLPNSGKTVYMTMLYYYLLEFQSPKWRIVIDDPDTQAFIDTSVDQIRKGEFMSNTPYRPTEASKLYSYKLVNDRDDECVELKFFDLAGEFYLEAKQFTDHAGRKLSVVQHLNQCDGILFLISPLKEDAHFLKEKGKTYYGILGNLFRSMQRERNQSNKLTKLEQYVAFGITKVDHPEVYKDYCPPSKAENSILEILGENTTLNWFNSFFHIEVDRRKGKISVQPGKYNRCNFFYISPFGVYEENGTIKSPVCLVENEKIVEGELNKRPQEADAIFDESSEKKNSPYEKAMPSNPIPSSDSWKKPTQSVIYKIEKAKFNPINVLSPVEWLLEGINQYRPEFLSSKEGEENGEDGR